MEKLTTSLSLVGRLDDTPGDDTPRERFRRFLEEEVPHVGEVRDYVEECLRKPDKNLDPNQYHRALQDLVNQTGRFLGFDVDFGRHKGASGGVGYDGFWRSKRALGLVSVINM